MILQGRLLLDPSKSPEPGWLRLDGDRIAEIGDGRPPDSPTAGDVFALITPAFVDAHVHLPQLGSVGCDGLDLLDWLDRVIFPAEMRWADQVVARAEAAAAIARFRDEGTLAFAGYLTSHPWSVEAVLEAQAGVAVRGVAGQVLMDRGGPDALLGHDRAPAAASADGRLRTSINPRFAVACTQDLLAEAAAGGGDAIIQTHLAESPRECALVRELFPGSRNYTDVYDAHGLLTPRTLLAHCVHVGPDEWRCIADRGSVVVHCPGANTFLRSGLFDLRAARDHAVRLALGSDLAAGPDLAMPRVARAMIEVAKLRSLTVDPGGPVPSPPEAWAMITRGNAEAIDVAGGVLEVDAPADLLVIRHPFEIDEHLIGRLLYGWDRSWIETRVLAGVIAG